MKYLYFNTNMVAHRIIDPNKLQLTQLRKFNKIMYETNLIWIYFGKL